MKKIYQKAMAAVLATSMILGTGLTVSAAEVTESSESNTLGTEFSCEIKNDPTYTVTIPSSITIDKDGTQVNIEAANVANLDGQKISVTIAGTNYFRNQMVLSGKTAAGMNTVMRYQIITSDGTVIETTGEKDQANGMELASFTENGVVSYTVKPVIAINTETGVNYTGSITYGISLTDVAE